MSKKKLNDEVRLYTRNEFEHADRVNRIRMFMIQPELELNNKDWEYYMQLETIFHLCANELSRTVAIAKIRHQYPDLSHHTVLTAYSNMTELFGNLQENNRRLQKHKLLERLCLMADKAFSNAVFVIEEKDEEGNVTERELVNADYMELTRKILRDIADIEGYGKEKEELDADSITIPPLIITSNPEAFLKSRKNEDDEG